MKRHPPRHFVLFGAALAFLVIMIVILIDRVPHPTAVPPADDHTSVENLSRAMTFSPPAERKP